QHRLRQRAGVIEVRKAHRAAFGGGDPFLVRPLGRTWQRDLRPFEVGEFLFRQHYELVWIPITEDESAFRADDDRAVLGELHPGRKVGLWHLAAVVPGEQDRRQLAAGGKLIADDAPDRRALRV